MNIIHQKVCLIGLISCFSPLLYAQSPPLEQVALNSQERLLAQHYLDTLGASALVYRGSEYVDYDNRIEGHQYFATNYWVEGAIYAYEKFYPKVMLLYDEHKDLLLIDAPSMAYSIQLPFEKVDAFEFLGHQFIKIDPSKDSTSKNLPAKGYYELLYDGKVKALSKRRKTYEQEIEGTEIEKWFEVKDRYYIFKEGAYSKVKYKRSVLKALDDHTKELKKYIKKNRLDFRYATQEAIVRTVQFYDSLTADE